MSLSQRFNVTSARLISFTFGITLLLIITAGPTPLAALKCCQCDLRVGGNCTAECLEHPSANKTDFMEAIECPKYSNRSFVCGKFSYKSVAFSRSCVPYKKNMKTDHCHHHDRMKKTVSYTICYCNKDLCNASPTVQNSLINWKGQLMVAVTVALFVNPFSTTHVF